VGSTRTLEDDVLSEPIEDVPLMTSDDSRATPEIHPLEIQKPEASRPLVDIRLLLFFSAVAVIVLAVHSAAEAHFDFGVFYYAARMVLEKSGHALYSLEAQRIFQARFHRPSSQLFYGLPCSLIPYLPIAVLPIQIAFAAWTVISLALVHSSVRFLEIQSKLNSGNWPIILSVAFTPVAICLVHGQLSIMILAIYVLTYAQWFRGRRFWGGVVLAVALLKFQLVVGFVAVLLLKRKWRELAGFFSGAVVMLALSSWMAGIPALVAYPKFVRLSEGGFGSEPANMASLRGFLSLFGSNHLALVFALSILAILFAAWSWKDLDRGFSAGILAAILTSYHCNPQDLSLCLIPFFLLVKTGLLTQQRMDHVVMLSLFTPMLLAAIGLPFALLAPVLAASLWWLCKNARPELSLKPAH
jgi:hypothetical protein